MTALRTVQSARDTLTTVLATAQPADRPRIDAIRSVINADLNDRRVGLTTEGQDSPGLTLARRYDP